MFSRLFKNFLNKPASEEAVEQVRRRYRRTFKEGNAIPKQQQQQQQSWFAKTAAPATAAAQPAAATQPTNRSKYIRYAFIALGTGYFALRVFGRDPLGRTLSNPSSAGPKFVLTIEKLDDKIANYRSTYYAASQGIRKAFSQQARNLMLQRLGLQFDDLTDEQISQLQLLGKIYNEGLKNLSPIIDDHMKSLQDVVLIVGETDEIKAKKTEAQEKLSKAVAAAIEQKIALELNLLNEIGHVLAKEKKSLALLQKDTSLTSRIKNSFLGLQNGGKNEFLMEKVSQISTLPVYEKGKVFVLQFKGDVMASGVAKLREEITAVLSVADPKRGDRVIVQLNSPGGTVTGYGLGAAQIIRLKNAGLPVTVSVDEVAASGGYMMACVADRIVASPFAVIGSIGVVQTMPNFSEFLERHGVSVEDVTAGKYKRTMTPYKKNTEEDRKKVKSDLEAVFALFRNFIKTNRPNLNVDDVATGEIWHGSDALKKGLIDELRTTDDLILQARDAGFDVYKLSVRPANIGPFGDPSDGPIGALMSDSSSFSEKIVAWVSWMVRQVVMDVVRKEVLPPLGSSWENGEYDWRAERDVEEIGSHDIRKMILAIDPSLSQNPPKL